MVLAGEPRRRQADARRRSTRRAVGTGCACGDRFPLPPRRRGVRRRPAEAVVEPAQAPGSPGRWCILAAADDGRSRSSASVSRSLALALRRARPSASTRTRRASSPTTPAAAAAVVSAMRIAAPPCGRALGEIGLDYHYDFAPRDVQQRGVPRAAAGSRRRREPAGDPFTPAKRTRTRSAPRATRSRRGIAGVFHCFTGDREMARAPLDIGFYLSLPASSRFRRLPSLREWLKTVPRDRLLIETDSPFLAPVPYRGKRNEPAHVARVVETRRGAGAPLEAIAAQTAANFRRRSVLRHRPEPVIHERTKSPEAVLAAVQ